MGAWDVGYKDSDDYYNHIGDFSKPVIDSLKSALERAKQGKFNDGSGGSDWVNTISVGAFRAQVMWTYQVLEAVRETSLTAEDAQVIADSIQQVLKEAKLGASQWKASSSFLNTVRGEMNIVQEWLSKFQPSGFIADRIGAIVNTMERRGIGNPDANEIANFRMGLTPESGGRN